jgi:F-type H+-transporting ATPase subunit b
LSALLQVALLLAAAAGMFAQEHPPAPAHAAEAPHGEAAAEHGPSIVWKWANFGLLAGGLGYLIGRHAPAFFRSRTEEIQKGMADAARIKRDADQRVAEVERRLATLEQEIATLRSGAVEEMAAEAKRIQDETARQLAKTQEQAEQEIASAAKTARKELKAYSADLAVSLAEQKVQSRLTPAVEQSLIDTFVSELRSQGQPEVQ